MAKVRGAILVSSTTCLVFEYTCCLTKGVDETMAKCVQLLTLSYDWIENEVLLALRLSCSSSISQGRLISHPWILGS